MDGVAGSGICEASGAFYSDCPRYWTPKCAGDIIFIVEGEKDGLILVSHGFCATCNVGGAGNWLPEYTEALTGACVVVIADKDEPGRKHAASVAKELQGKAKTVRVVELPDRNDTRIKDSAELVQCRRHARGIGNIGGGDAHSTRCDLLHDCSPGGGRGGCRATDYSVAERRYADHREARM